MRKETCCRHIGYSYRLTARVLLYAPSHRQDNTYHSLCYTSRGALAGTRNSSMGTRKEGIVLFNNVLNTFYLQLYGVRSNDWDTAIIENEKRFRLHKSMFPLTVISQAWKFSLFRVLKMDRTVTAVPWLKSLLKKRKALMEGKAYENYFLFWSRLGIIKYVI